MLVRDEQIVMTPADLSPVLERIQEQARLDHVRLTLHAHVEMADETLSLDDMLEAIASEQAQILENYPEHRRGACCLLGGSTNTGRPVHVVCTTAQPALIQCTNRRRGPGDWARHSGTWEFRRKNGESGLLLTPRNCW